MPMGRLAMRHVREVMRLKAAGVSVREIGRRVGAVPSTVRLTIRRFEAAGLSWPLADDVTDTVLEDGYLPVPEPNQARGGARNRIGGPFTASSSASM